MIDSFSPPLVTGKPLFALCLRVAGQPVTFSAWLHTGLVITLSICIASCQKLTVDAKLG